VEHGFQTLSHQKKRKKRMRESAGWSRVLVWLIIPFVKLSLYENMGSWSCGPNGHRDRLWTLVSEILKSGEEMSSCYWRLCLYGNWSWSTMSRSKGNVKVKD
jgi:hypothetical protein